MIKAISYPRAAVIGNPSDGFFGKTIAFPFSNFQVEAQLNGREGILVGANVYDSLDAFNKAYSASGADPQHPLLSATLRRFYQHCNAHDISLHGKGFEITFESNIPREVGLAGSSAIIKAIVSTLLEYYQVRIPRELLANLILEVETEELGIGAGLQDRVVQVFEKPVFMDFNRQQMEAYGYGEYDVLDSGLFQNLFIAYRAESAESSEVVHNDLGARFRKGDPKVHAVMGEFASLTDSFLDELKGKADPETLGALMNRNFDLRASVCAISSNNLEMIELARSIGASAKFTGSGGAIIGIYQSPEMYLQLESAFNKKGIQIFKPTIVNTDTW